MDRKRLVLRLIVEATVDYDLPTSGDLGQEVLEREAELTDLIVSKCRCVISLPENSPPEWSNILNHSIVSAEIVRAIPYDQYR